MSSQIVSSPGRLGLLGEHCDWAGGVSLVVPLDLRIKARFEPKDGAPVLQVQSTHRPTRRHLDATYSAPLNPGRFRNTNDPLRYVAATWTVLRHAGVPVAGGTLSLESTLPMGRGFSSSAALCVAAARALSQELVDADFRQIADWATTAERDLVGIACGALDPLACAADAPLFIEWENEGGSPRKLTAGEPLHVVAGAFSRPRDAPGILRTLQALNAGDASSPDCSAVQTAIRTWAELARDGMRALEDGRAADLGGAMNAAQRVYETHLHDRLPALRAPGLVRVCAAVRDAGALGAKFSGAGGDGSVVALANGSEHADQIGRRMAQEGLAWWAVSVR